MAVVRSGRMTAAPGGSFVVFLIGMRVNSLWKVHRWLPVFVAMPRMLRELARNDDVGLLGYRTRWGGRNVELVQYWRSFDELRTYARERDAEHLPAWADYNRTFGSDGAVGVWHETYVVDGARCEAVYRNMPFHGLAKATTAVPAEGRRRTAAGRLGRTDGRDVPPGAAAPADEGPESSDESDGGESRR